MKSGEPQPRFLYLTKLLFRIKEKIKCFQDKVKLKKKHSSRLVGGVEMGSRGGEDAWQGGGRWTGQSHIHMQIQTRRNNRV